MAGQQASANRYPYERLNNANQIRVLDLQPGSWKDDIRGRLRTVPRDSTAYEALSYVWGPATDGRTLTLDTKHELPITDNLFLALRRLRKRRSIRTLWVDAVCINQLDDVEKADQVADMAETYLRAAIVNVWLGESPTARSIHLKYIFVQYLPWRLSQFSNLRRGWLKARSDLAWGLWLLRSPFLTPKASNKVAPWHSRAWTLQEYLFSRKLRLCLGRAAAEVRRDLYWSFGIKPFDLATAIRRLALSAEDLESIRSRLTTLPMSSAVIGFVGLNQLIKLMHGLSASDPRDMVYSVHGILPEKEKQFVPPDYTVMYPEVCARATAASLKSSTIVLWAYVTFCEGKDRGFASWAVEFAAKHQEPCYSLYPSLLRKIVMGDFQWPTLDLFGRTLGTAIQCRPVLASDKVTLSRPNGTWLKAPEHFDSMDLAEPWLDYANGVSGCASLITLSNGVEALGPAVVQSGDYFVRLCYSQPFHHPQPEVFIWLHAREDYFQFRGLGMVPGDTVYTSRYNWFESDELEDGRTESEIKAGFQTFHLR